MQSVADIAQRQLLRACMPSWKRLLRSNWFSSTDMRLLR